MKTTTTKKLADKYGKPHYAVRRVVKELIALNVNTAIESYFKSKTGVKYPMYKVAGHMVECLEATLEASMRWKQQIAPAILVRRGVESNVETKVEKKTDRPIPTPENNMCLYSNVASEKCTCDDAIVADSRDVAERFGKNHHHVLDKIKDYVKSPHVPARFFVAATYSGLIGNRQLTRYEMTRDGFTLLVMGFTGERALEFKMNYIAAFNAMEAELMKPQDTIGTYTQDYVLGLEADNADAMEDLRTIKSRSEAKLEELADLKDEELQMERKYRTDLRNRIEDMRHNQPKAIEGPKVDEYKFDKKEVGEARRKAAILDDLIDDGFASSIPSVIAKLGTSSDIMYKLIIDKLRCIKRDPGEYSLVIPGSVADTKRYMVNITLPNGTAEGVTIAHFTILGYNWIKAELAKLNDIEGADVYK